MPNCSQKRPFKKSTYNNTSNPPVIYPKTINAEPQSRTHAILIHIYSTIISPDLYIHTIHSSVLPPMAADSSGHSIAQLSPIYTLLTSVLNFTRQRYCFFLICANYFINNCIFFIFCIFLSKKSRFVCIN